MSSPSTSDTYCFSFESQFTDPRDSNYWVNCLNLTDISKYVAAYCTNPPKDDSCPFDFCPNPEIAGPLVRIANYVTTLCIAILVFYSPKRVKEAFWSQILTVYSLLLTCLVTIIRGQLTRFHALVVLALVLSPVTVYFVGYSIRSFWSRHHRLENLLGPSHYLQRFVVLLAGVWWLALFIYAYLPRGVRHFAQASCKGRSVTEGFYLTVPFLYLQALGEIYLDVLFALPFVILTIAWIAAIVLRREEIWPPGLPYSPRFVKVWRTVGYYYPFIQFLSVVVLPMAYWILVVELCTYGTMDNNFSLSFGQVFTLFVAVPPFILTIKLLGKAWRWFRGISWVQRIAGPPPERPKQEKRESYLSLVDEY